MKHIRKFDELNESFFSLNQRIFDPIRFKKMANKYFNICKDDAELLELVDKYVSEFASYSEGPDPRPASRNLRKKIKELFPEENNEELYELRIIRTGLSADNSVTTVYNYLILMLIEKLGYYFDEYGNWVKKK
jgi:hypothetical protein